MGLVCIDTGMLQWAEMIRKKGCGDDVGYRSGKGHM